ncbi:MAG TPA: MFS transporter [Micromonosporaceae bacterium]
MSDPSGTLAPLHYRPYRILVSARSVSMLGSSIAPLALAFAVLDLTGSVSDLGYVVATRTLLNVVFLLFGGAIADRLPRHLVMVGSSVLAGASQGAAAVLFLTHTATMPILLGLAAVNGMAAALAQPASAAIMPQTVPSTMRKQANALSRLSMNVVGIAGTSVAGLLVAIVGSGWCVAIDAGSFFLAALLFAVIRVAPVTGPSGTKDKVGLFTSLHEGWRVFIGHTWLWVVVLGFMLYNAANAAGLGVLGPHFADLTVGRKLWGVVLAVDTIGAIAGAFVALRVKVKRQLAYGVAAVGTGALLPLALVFTPTLAALLVAAFIGGLGTEQFGIAWETSMQENIETDMLARVYSYDMLGSLLAIPLGQLMAGPAEIAFGARGAMLGVGVLMLLATAAMLVSKSVWRLKHGETKPEVPLVPVPDLEPDLV